MTHLAATATPVDPLAGYLLATAALAVVLAGYAVICWWWPYGFCRKCKGSGKRMSPSGKYFRLCPRCKGSSRRLRIGRRVWIYLRGVEDDAR